MNINLLRHPLSALLPALSPEESHSLAESIRALGVFDPITLYAGQVLDGWNRYSIAIDQGLECPMQDLPADMDPVEYVRGKTRVRNLNAGQRAMLEVSLREWRANGVNTGAATIAGPSATSAEMAASAGVSERTIRSAKAVKSNTVEAVKAAVADGSLPLASAERIAKLPKKQQETAIAAPPPAKRGGPAMIAAPDSDDFESPTELMAGMEREIRELQAQVAAAQADDQRAETLKWRQMHQVAERRQQELMERVAEREKELQRQANTLKRIGKAVGCDDPTKVAAVVEAMARQARVAA
ncbi:MAG: hypothetical protein H0W48_00180 [Methylibium sp.]|nr:hypothetical protein [Methylibium sp.]